MRSIRRLIVTGLLAVGVLVPLLFFSGHTPHAQTTLSSTNARAYWVPPGNCVATESASSATPVRITVDGASNTPVIKAQFTSALAGATATFICNISPPEWIVSTVQQFTIVDAVFMYSPQNALTATQAAVLASGTLNGSIIFSSITYPAAAASETASAVTPVRADSGTMVLTPVVGSFNVSTATAGAYYSQKFVPAASTLLWPTDFQQLLLTVKLVTDGGSATITSPGVLVHYKGL